MRPGPHTCLPLLALLSHPLCLKDEEEDKDEEGGSGSHMKGNGIKSLCVVYLMRYGADVVDKMSEVAMR